MLNSSDEQYRGIYFFGMFCSHLILPNIRHLIFFFICYFSTTTCKTTWKNIILKGEIKLNYLPHSTKFILRSRKQLYQLKVKTTIDTTFTWLTREDFWTLLLPGLHWTECYFQRCEQRDCGVEFQPVCLCVGRATSPSRRATLSPRAAPRGWWIPRSQSEPSAPSTRPPFSEWTFPLLPPSHPTPPDPWASPCPTHLPSSPLSCAFHCDTLGRTPTPPCYPPLPSQPPPAFPAENYTAFPTLVQHFQKIYINTTFKLSNLLLLATFFFLVYFVCLSNAVHTAFPFTITSHYWLTVISSLYLLHFFPPRCFSCSIRRRPRWGFSLWSFNRWLFGVLRKSESLRPKVSRSAHPLPGRTCSLGTAAVREVLVL